MKNGILFVIIVSCLILAGCQSQQKMTCNKPYILVGSECCLDKDNNAICDKDENLGVQKQEEQIKSKESIEIVAKRFGRFFEQKDAGAIYDMLIPTSQAMISRDAFINTFNFKFKNFDTTITYTESYEDSPIVAFAKYDAGELLKVSMKSIRFELVNNEWRVDAFADILNNPCGDNICREEERGDLRENSCSILDCLASQYEIVLGQDFTTTFLGHKIEIKSKDDINATTAFLAHPYVGLKVVLNVNGKNIPLEINSYVASGPKNSAGEEKRDIDFTGYYYLHKDNTYKSIHHIEDNIYLGINSFAHYETNENTLFIILFNLDK